MIDAQERIYDHLVIERLGGDYVLMVCGSLNAHLLRYNLSTKGD
ncbi:MAG: hypothetical protein QXM43_01760 [Desulfurococcaceae archaeon]